jgi:predicted nucleic acid-binding protein
MDDIAFIALTEFMDCKLWTGDQKLLKGIRAKGYTNALSTDEVKALRIDLEKKG